MDRKNLKKEQIIELQDKTPEEILDIVKREGWELSEEEMGRLSGGSDMIVWDKSVVCPVCGSTCVYKTDDGISKYFCAICGARFDW